MQTKQPTSLLGMRYCVLSCYVVLLRKTTSINTTKVLGIYLYTQHKVHRCVSDKELLIGSFLYYQQHIASVYLLYVYFSNQRKMQLFYKKLYAPSYKISICKLHHYLYNIRPPSYMAVSRSQYPRYEFKCILGPVQDPYDILVLLNCQQTVLTIITFSQGSARTYLLRLSIQFSFWLSACYLSSYPSFWINFFNGSLQCDYIWTIFLIFIQYLLSY